MKTWLIVPVLAMTGAGVGAAALQSRDEVRSAEILAGRVAGEPQSCVNLRELRGNRSAAGGAILFDGRGDLVYLNSPPGGCPALNGDAIRIETTSTRLCRGDIVTVIDRTGGIDRGGCGLGDFVPYRRPDRR